MACPARGYNHPMLVLLGLLSVASADQGVVSRWALEEIEQRVREHPTADDLHDLSELWARIAEADEVTALGAHVAAYDACMEAALPSREFAVCEALQPDYAQAMRDWSHAEKRALQLLRDFPDDHQVPDAVALLAWIWDRQGREGMADAALTWVAASTKDPREAEQAWVRIGEHAFERWDELEAITAYDRAVAEDGPLSTWALYRTAWAWYRLGDYVKAIDTMKAVIGAADANRSKVILQDEALKDLDRFMTDAGVGDERAGCRLGRRECVLAQLRRLAEVYQEQGKWEEAIQMRRRLIAEAPELVEENAHRAEIIHDYFQMGRFSEALTELERVEHPSPTQRHTLAVALYNVALATHEKASRSGDLDLANQVLEVYDTYLEHYDEHPHEVSTYRAILLEQLGRTDEALAAYRANAATWPNARYTLPVLEAIARLSGDPLQAPLFTADR